MRPLRCDYPGCDRAPTDELPLEPGVSLTIDGVPWAEPQFRLCPGHAPEIARIVADAAGRAIRRHKGRLNDAPGDAEWQMLYADDHEE